MGVDKDNFEHPLTSTVEEAIKIISSEKFRSQGLTVPYALPKHLQKVAHYLGELGGVI